MPWVLLGAPGLTTAGCLGGVLVLSVFLFLRHVSFCCVYSDVCRILKFAGIVIQPRGCSPDTHPGPQRGRERIKKEKQFSKVAREAVAGHWACRTQPTFGHAGGCALRCSDCCGYLPRCPTRA